jgi:hypothetical protein
MFAVDDIDETLERLRKRGAQLVGEVVVQYKDAYRLCYIRGPGGFSSDSPRNSAERNTKTMTKSDQCQRARLAMGKFWNGTGAQ